MGFEAIAARQVGVPDVSTVVITSTLSLLLSEAGRFWRRKHRLSTEAQQAAHSRPEDLPRQVHFRMHHSSAVSTDSLQDCATPMEQCPDTPHPTRRSAKMFEDMWT